MVDPQGSRANTSAHTVMLSLSLALRFLQSIRKVWQFFSWVSVGNGIPRDLELDQAFAGA